MSGASNHRARVQKEGSTRPAEMSTKIAEEAEWSLGWLRRNLDDNRERTVEMLEEHYDRTIEQCGPIVGKPMADVAAAFGDTSFEGVVVRFPSGTPAKTI